MPTSSPARERSVTEAIYDAGFNSSGRFYEKSTDMLGMTPSQYRTGGANEEIKFAVGQTSLDAILVASSKKGVATILLGDDPDKLVRNHAFSEPGDAILLQLPSYPPSMRAIEDTGRRLIANPMRDDGTRWVLDLGAYEAAHDPRLRMLI